MKNTANLLNVLEEVNNLKLSYCDNDSELTNLNEFHNQLVIIYSESGIDYYRDDVSELLKSENDICDKIECESLIEDIRNIQDSVINFLSK